MIPGLSPAASAWTLTSTAAAAISYADRGTSAIAASGILNCLGWTESQLGTVQSSFFLGYGLTQVVGGLLSEGLRGPVHAEDDDVDDTDNGVPGDELDQIFTKDTSFALNDGGGNTSSRREAFRSVLPLALLLTALSTLAFPAAATYGGPIMASVDRFLLGLFEGLLLPSAMSGVSALVPTDRRATASSALIAGCYLGSAMAYASATVLFSSPVVDWISDPAWPYVFYVNGVLSLLCLVVARDEFDWLSGEGRGTNTRSTTSTPGEPSTPLLSSARDLAMDTIAVAKATVGSVSGRAILAAQVGQGALLYSIASWGPLYVERVGSVGAVAADAATKTAAGASSFAGGDAAVTSTAAAAAAALILPQLTQAAVGVGVGTASDALAQNVGTVATRRILQGLSGVVPALILWYLATGPSASVDASATISTMASPLTLFAAAQTASALSLGAVSVSHLDVAPRNAGTVYALGNVAAAVSGSITVNLFGKLLEAGGGSDFRMPFRLVASISALGSLIYATTVRSEPEILVKRRHFVA